MTAAPSTSPDSDRPDGGSVAWWQAEPQRMRRDLDETAARFPELSWTEPPTAVRAAGGWRGRLPCWPFDRPAPPGLEAVGPGLDLLLVYSQAHPMVPPSIFPLDPQPHIAHYTDHRWHLAGDGSLCLLQHAAQWTGTESLVELLLKAAGWRIEFALMTAGLIEQMTEAGIATDPSLDLFISYLDAPAADAAPTPPPTTPSSTAEAPTTPRSITEAAAPPSQDPPHGPAARP